MILLKNVPSSDPHMDALLLAIALAFYVLLLIGLASVKGA